MTTTPINPEIDAFVRGNGTNWPELVAELTERLQSQKTETGDLAFIKGGTVQTPVGAWKYGHVDYYVPVSTNNCVVQVAYKTRYMDLPASVDVTDMTTGRQSIYVGISGYLPGVRSVQLDANALDALRTQTATMRYDAVREPVYARMAEKRKLQNV